MKEIILDKITPNIKFDAFDENQIVYISKYMLDHKQQSCLHVLEIICGRKTKHVIKYDMFVSDKIEISFDYNFDKMKQIIKHSATKINKLYDDKSEFECFIAILLKRSTITISDTLDDYKFILYSFDLETEL